MKDMPLSSHICNQQHPQLHLPGAVEPGAPDDPQPQEPVQQDYGLGLGS